MNWIANLSEHRNTIILGDFNAPSIRWGYQSSSATGKIIEDLLDNTALIRIPSDPTFLSYAGHTSSPDLALVHANLSSRTTLSLGDAMDGYGHRPILMHVHLKNHKTRPIKLTRWNFKKAQWKKYSQLTNRYITEDVIDGNPDASAERFVKTLLRAAKESIPRGQVKKYAPFWNESLDHLKRERNAARRHVEQFSTIEHRIALKRAQAKLTRAIIVAKRSAYRTFVSNLDFRKDGANAHRFISRLNNELSTRRWEPIIINGKILTSPSEVATALSKNYAAISKLHITAAERKSILHASTPSCQTMEEYNIFTKDFSRDELNLAISSLKGGKTAGPDEIYPDFMKNLGSVAQATLLKLINLTWNTRVPQQWRKAEVISLLKPGKPANNLNSYRPISLTSVCCKVAEKMIERRLREFVESKNAISDCQAGFRKHRSTMDQVVKFTQAVKDAFHRKQSTIAILVDFKAAYDKIWRKMLINKLNKLGVNGNMLKWIRSFLSQRSIRCSFLNASSKWKQLRQGLPQGAVLSCLLFNIMIDNLKAALKQVPGISCLFFADDVLIWATGSNINALEDALNETLLKLENWANKNKMVVSAEKTVSQLFTMSTKAPPVNLKYKGTLLQQVQISKYLGINLDPKLSFSAHIADTAVKSQKRINLLKRLTATKWGANQDVLSTAYKTYIRPVLEYGSEVTSLASKSSLTKYDLVQNNALRLITGGAKSTPIVAMQLQTGIQPLESRRDICTLKFWERAHRADVRHWNKYSHATQRLKTQTSPLTHAEALINKYQLQLEDRAPIKYYTSEVLHLPSINLDLISLISNKASASPAELKAYALETIHLRYPSSQWLHIYTDGSYLPETRGVGAGWYCRLFEDSVAVGRNASNYDGEVCAIYKAANQLLANDMAPGKVVFLVDSQAAITALSSNNPTNCINTVQGRSKLADLITTGWEVALQWIPSHVGIQGNEKADFKAKHGAQMDQPEVPLTLSRAKHLIATTIHRTTRDHLKTISTGKKWESLATLGPIPVNLERAEAVARFRLTTGHDYLQAHLHRIGLAADETCPLCNLARMDGEHLQDCPALTDISNDDITNLYWEARRQMVEQPRNGVG